ncbi:MAG: hypothetical protein IH856_25450 [Deltaproteobacteria bacterium]|nr:hypothetical protein [Deltaproteobacteria bacterium]
MEQTMDSLLQPDALLPAQYLETIRRENHLDPEKMLMLAVLEDGVICFQKYLSTRDEREKRLLSEAEEWLLMEQNGEDWLFSFDNVCETLGLNPGYIREGLLRLRHHQLRERDQVRPRVNRSRYASRN